MVNKLDLVKLSDEFINAEPFPHIVIDNFFNEEQLQSALDNFPAEDNEIWNWKSNDENSIKLMCQDPDALATIPEIKNVIDTLNGTEFLSQLECITTMPNLYSDKSLSGGGLHQLNNGGFLKLHVDFNVADSLPNLNRRLNLILFLNKEWKNEYGGQLELWNTDCTECIVSVEPIFNRAVIFDTQPKDDIMPWHGNPKKLNLPEGIARRSIALYYYTEEKPDTSLSKKHRTLYQK